VCLGAFLWSVYSSADYAVVSKVVGPVALGYYALAFQMVSFPVQKLTGNVNQAVYPLYCRLQHDRSRLRDWYLRVTALLSLLGMPVLGGMAIVADDAFALLLGERWLPAVVPFQVLACVGMLMTVSYSLPPLINALGRPDINLRYTIISTIILPSGFVILGLTHGLVGICWAWLILYPLIEVWIVHSTRHLTGCSVKDLAVAQLPVVMGVIAMALPSWPSICSPMFPRLCSAWERLFSWARRPTRASCCSWPSARSSPIYECCSGSSDATSRNRRDLSLPRSGRSGLRASPELRRCGTLLGISARLRIVSSAFARMSKSRRHARQ
jgi:O-antigen/teichoic acid export membrane protein